MHRISLSGSFLYYNPNKFKDKKGYHLLSEKIRDSYNLNQLNHVYKYYCSIKQVYKGQISTVKREQDWIFLGLVSRCKLFHLFMVKIYHWELVLLPYFSVLLPNWHGNKVSSEIYTFYSTMHRYDCKKNNLSKSCRINLGIKKKGLYSRHLGIHAH